MATFAPSAASRFAIAAPMPREPPVTRATFLDNLDTNSSPSFSGITTNINQLFQPSCDLAREFLIERKRFAVWARAVVTHSATRPGARIHPRTSWIILG